MFNKARLIVLKGVFKVFKFSAYATAASASASIGYQPKLPDTLGK